MKGRSTPERFRDEVNRQWREKIDEMPFFKVPGGYEIQVIPPFGGLDARFRVKRPDGEEISIYCDWYCNAGYWGPILNPQPYWEIYPYDGDVGRCGLKDTDTLWKMIKGEEV